MSSQENNQRRNLRSDVGVFWDLHAIFDSIKYPHNDLNFSAQLGVELVNMAGTFNRNPELEVFMKAFSAVSSLSTRDGNILGELGFELINTSSIDELLYPDIGSHVLMWLWDRCRSTEPSTNPTIIFVSSDKKYLKLLQMLKDRGVFVVLFSELLQTELRTVCIQASNMVVNIADNTLVSTSSSDNMVYLEKSTRGTLSMWRNEQQEQYLQQQQQNQQPRPMLTSFGRAIPSSNPGQVVYESNIPIYDSSKKNTPEHSPTMGYRSPTLSYRNSPPVEYRTVGQRSPPVEHRIMGQRSPPLDYRTLSRVEDYHKQAAYTFPNLKGGPAIKGMSSQRDTLQNEFSFRSDTKDFTEVQEDFSSFRDSPTDPNVHAQYYDDNLPDSYLQGGLEELTFEQQSMQEQLGNWFRQKNIQMAVSTLRKIYTKQSRVFRIPTILSVVMPSSGAQFPDSNQFMSEYSLTNVIFTLNCIQWSIGAQKNANSDSFKYKMNKKISAWLLKEQIKKGVPSQFVPELGNVAVIVVQSILKQVMEFELCQEILEMAKIPNPIEALVPYVYSWIRSPDHALSGRARDFADQHGIAYNNILSSANTQLSSNDVGLSQASFGYLGISNSSISSLQASNIQSQTQPQARTMSWPLAEAEDTDTTQELLFLLKKYPEGLLSSQVSMAYADEFKKPLRLHGQSLKDIMLGIGAGLVSCGSHSADVAYVFAELSPF